MIGSLNLHTPEDNTEYKKNRKYMCLNDYLCHIESQYEAICNI